MRNTKKNRETEKQLRMAIKTECEKVYGTKIGTNAANFNWDLRLMPQPNFGTNWAYVSWNDFDGMIDAIRTYGTCYYTGKKPSDKTVSRTCDYFVKVTEKQLKALITIKYDSLQSVKNLLDWKNGLNDKERKQKERKQKAKEMQLDFDGEITLKEINDKYGKDYYVNDKNTQISFHKRIDTRYHEKVPEFTIKIKPARKDYNEKGWFMCVYNKAEFEEAMKHAVKKIEVSEDLIKYALSFGVTINANKKNEFELRYSCDGTNNRWWAAYKATMPANATKTGIKNAIKTFGEKRASRIH